MSNSTHCPHEKLEIHFYLLIQPIDYLSISLDGFYLKVYGLLHLLVLVHCGIHNINVHLIERIWFSTHSDQKSWPLEQDLFKRIVKFLPLTFHFKIQFLDHSSQSSWDGLISLFESYHLLVTLRPYPQVQSQNNGEAWSPLVPLTLILKWRVKIVENRHVWKYLLATKASK